MKYRLSEATERLIERLYAKAGLWNRFVYAESPEAIVQQVAQTGEIAAIPELLSILLTGDKQSVQATAEAIQHLTSLVPPAEFTRLDEFVRANCSHWLARRTAWYWMKPGEIKHLVNLGGASVAVLGMASFHRNGRIREEAVRALAGIQTGGELPFLLTRANDWVEAIRLAVREFLSDRLRSEYAVQFLTCLPLALRLEKASRGNHAWIIQGIREVLTRDECRATLERGFVAADRPARRFCFDIAFGLDPNRQREALSRAFRDDDVQIRRAAVDKLAVSFSVAGHCELLATARNDSLASVRRRALGIYKDSVSAQAEKEFERALLDSSIAVREQAREFFRKSGSIDVRQYYIERLQAKDARTLCVAIAGVGETGTASDTRLIEPFLQNSLARIRAAAVCALGRLGGDGGKDLFVAALVDPSGKVAREAMLVLSKQVNLVGAAKLWEVYVGVKNSHGKRFALNLLARVNKWDSITCLLQSLSDRDERVAQLGRRYVVRWFARYNRSFAAPTAAQLTKLRNVLAERNLLVSDDAQRQLESILTSFAGSGRS